MPLAFVFPFRFLLVFVPVFVFLLELSRVVSVVPQLRFVARFAVVLSISHQCVFAVLVRVFARFLVQPFFSLLRVVVTVVALCVVHRVLFVALSPVWRPAFSVQSALV